MIKKIKVTISKEHYFICDTNTIGRVGENECVELEMMLYEHLCESWVYLDIISPDGSKYKTPRLEIEDNIVRYAIPNSVLTHKGLLSVQMIVHNEAGVIWATNIKEFYVKDSINAVNEIENKEDFITEAQKLLDEIKNGGTGGTGGTSVSEEIQVSSAMPTSGSVMLWYEIEGNSTVDLNNFFLENNENDLIINYQDDLDLNFEVVNNELIVYNGVSDLDFTINEKKEMEVSYE